MAHPSDSTGANATSTSSVLPVGTQVPLDELPEGHCAFVNRIDAPADDADRLKVMGVCVGRRVQLIQRGDPMIIRVLGSRLGLSARLGHQVIVASCEAPECQMPAKNSV